MKKGFIENKNGRLDYVISGEGELPLLVFHGFGQNKEHFLKMLKPWESHFTVYSFDIPFHGESTWPSSEIVIKEEWNSLLESFLSNHSISTFSLLGFSMGGRYVLATLEKFPSQIEELFFIAPDGFRLNFWFRFSTHNILTRFVFRHLSYHPKALFAFVNLIERSRLMNAGLIKFVRGELSKSEERIRVYRSWTGIRLLKFKMQHILELIHSNGIKATLFIGSRDRVIKPEYFSSIKGLGKAIRVEILDSGHQHVMNLAAKKWYEDSKSKKEIISPSIKQKSSI